MNPLLIVSCRGVGPFCLFHNCGEIALQFFGADISLEFTSSRHSYLTCFLRNDNGNGVTLLGDTQCSTVAQTEFLRNVRVVRNGEDAGSRGDAVIVDNHGTIVEWGVLEENVLDELGIDIGIDGFARIFNVNQRHLLPDDDECSNEVLAHVVASTNNLHDGWIFLLAFHVLPRKEFQERIESVVGTQGEEKSTNIFLKQDDKCQHTHADEFVEDAAEEFHL